MQPDTIVRPQKTFYKAQVLPWDIAENPKVAESPFYAFHVLATL